VARGLSPQDRCIAALDPWIATSRAPDEGPRPERVSAIVAFDKSFQPSNYWRNSFQTALQALANQDTTAPAREHALLNVDLFASRFPFDEALITDVLNVARARLDDLELVRVLLTVLRNNYPGDERLGLSVARLAYRPYLHGPRSELRAIILQVALDDSMWLAAMRESWTHEAIGRALDSGDEAAAATITAKWLDLLEAPSPRIPAFLHQRPSLITAEGLTAVHRWILHQTAPTVAGWRFLASTDGTRDQHVTREALAISIDVGIETLRQAIAEESDEQARALLTGWLSRLIG
jgi:hypothetical protein